MTFDKTISPAFETIGRRKRLTGYIGQITDESGIVLHSMEYSNQRDADVALDALKHELLTDYAERGLVDAVPMCDQPAKVVVSTDFEDIRTQEFYEDERDYIEEKMQSAAPAGLVVFQIALDPPAEPCPLGDSEGDEVPLLVDVHTVLTRCTNNAALVGIIPEIERVLHRVEQALALDDDVPTDNPDVDSDPGTYGPSPLRRPSLYERIVAECQAELDARLEAAAQSIAA